jgi:hypothetical protein
MIFCEHEEEAPENAIDSINRLFMRSYNKFSEYSSDENGHFNFLRLIAGFLRHVELKQNTKVIVEIPNYSFLSI